MRHQRVFAVGGVVLAALTLTSVPASAQGGAPQITQQPTSQAVAPGGTATFNAAATGTPSPTVVWQVSTDGGATFNGTNDTSTSFVVSDVSTAQNGNEYRAVFTNSAGSVTTNAAVLSVGNGAGNIIITSEPRSQTVAPGGTVTFTASATGSPTPSAEWEVSTNSGAGTWTATGTTGPTLTIANVPSSLNGNKYRAVFSNSTGVAATLGATLTVAGSPAPPSSGGTPPSGTAVTLPAATVGQPYSVTLTAQGGQAPYTWTVAPGSGGPPAGLSLTPGGTLAGTPSGPAGLTQFGVSVADSSNPPQTAAESVSVTVNGPSPCPPGNVAFVCLAYRALLGRDPGSGEVSLWGGALNAGTLSDHGLVLAITSSPEFQSDLIQSFFKAYLHRGADRSGLAATVAFMQAGARDETIQSDTVGSDEYFIKRAASDNTTWLQAAFNDLLGRTADSGDLSYWRGQMAGGMNRAQVAAGLLNSPEYRADLVSLYFHKFLGRAPDSVGQATWTSVLAGGGTDEQVIAGLVSSQEFVNRG